MWGGAPVIQRNVFQFIRSYSAGGVVVITSGAPILQNNLFHDNSAPAGGGGVIAVKSSWHFGGAIRYNTFTLNMGNAIAIGAQGTPDIRGNIISSNVNGSGIYNNGGLPTVDYNDVWGNTTNYTGVTPGSHDISANPRFANVNARNFRLGGDSPCIDVADPASFPPTDFEGDARPQSAAPDIGADEALIAAIHVAPDGAATLPLPNAQGQIAFPAGLVTTSTIFTYTEMLTPAQATGGFAFAGQSFTLVATDAAGQPVTSFTGHYTLTLNYSDADWQAAGIPAEENLNLYYWNGSAWVGILPCAGCALDTVNNRITAVLDHLTEFALLGSPLAAPAVTTSKATGGVDCAGHKHRRGSYAMRFTGGAVHMLRRPAGRSSALIWHRRGRAPRQPSPIPRRLTCP